jgi:hypothetical protein
LTEVNQKKLPDYLEITCILFAPNAPHQNLVEDIWLQREKLLEKILVFVQIFLGYKNAI